MENKKTDDQKFTHEHVVVKVRSSPLDMNEALKFHAMFQFSSS